MTHHPDQHPAWCSPQHCTVTDPTLPVYRGEHRSEPVDLDLAPLVIGEDRLQVASAYLRESAGPFNAAHLVLTSGGRQLSMPILKAVGVLIQIARLVGKGEVTA